MREQNKTSPQQVSMLSGASLGSRSDGDACPLCLVKARWTGRVSDLQSRDGVRRFELSVLGEEASPGCLSGASLGHAGTSSQRA